MTVSLARTPGRLRGVVPLLCILLGLTWMVWGHPQEVAQRWLDGNNAFVQSVWLRVALFVIVGTALMSFFVPKTVISLIAGGVFGWPMGAGVLTVTAVVSAWFNYHVGRWSLSGLIGQRDANAEIKEVPSVKDRKTQAQSTAPLPHREIHVPERLGRSPFSPAGLIGEIRNAAADANFVTHLLARLAPVPATVISYTMGASRARQRPYLAAALLGSIPQWLWVYCGASAKEEMNSARLLGLFCSVAAAIVLAVWLPSKWFKKRWRSS